MRGGPHISPRGALLFSHFDGVKGGHEWDHGPEAPGSTRRPGAVEMATRWRADEDERLRRLYADGAPLAVIASQTGRSEDAVNARRVALGLERRRTVGWSPLADAVLREAARAGLPSTLIAEKLRRPVDQVRVRRQALGLGRAAAPRYSVADDAAIRARWKTGGSLEELARRLGRSPDAVLLRARQLGLHHPPRRRRWDRLEDSIVREGYSDGLTCEEIAQRLPERTPTAVAARARRLGLPTYARRWTADEEHLLARTLSQRPVDDAARRFGRTPEAIRRRARRLGLVALAPPRGRRAGTRWTAEDDALLRLHAALNPAQLAPLLGRSDHAVARRLRRLGLREGRERSPHHPTPANGGLTPGERALLDRELHVRGDRALFELERRLERTAAELRVAAGARP